MTQERVQTESVSYPTPGDVLDDRYRLVEILNAGGMGVIMRARQLTMDRDVAVKLLLPSKVDREITRARFEREVHLAKQLTHPNIIRLYDYGKHDKFLYIVMELLEGEDLKGVLRKEAPLPVGRAIDIAIQIADALTDAHKRNIVHRDLKPGNIYIQKLGSNRDFVKVLDFGIAKSLDSREFDVTSTGEVSGTVAYIAPEIVRGAVPGKVADVYAVGVLLLEMITGRKVFEGHTVAETLMNHLERPPRMPPSIANTKLAGVIEIALAKDPDDRYDDAQELLVGLNSVVSTVSRTLRLSEAEIQATFGNAPRVDGRTSDDVVPTRQRPATPARTQVGYAVQDMEPTQITPGSVSEEAVEMANQSRARSETPDPDAMGVKKKPWKLVGILFAFVVFGAIGGDWLYRNALHPQPDPEPTVTPPPVEPEPEPVTVTLQTTPPGATVRTADGDELGETPLTVPLEEATVLEFELDGHDPRTEVVDPETTTKVALELEPSVTGRELVTSAGQSMRRALAVAIVESMPEAEEKPDRRRPKPRRDRDPKPKPKPDSRPEKSEEPDEGKTDEAVEKLDIFGSVPDDTPEEPEEPPEKTAAELYEEARQHFIQRSYRDAISSCKEGAAKGASKCYALMANSYRMIGDTKSACKYYERAGIEHKSCMTLQNR